MTLCVCVTVCVIVCERWRSSTLEASIPAKDVGASQTPVADGSSRPDLKEQTQLRLSNTKITARKETKMEKKNTKKKTVCKENRCLDFVHLDAFIGERPRLHHDSPGHRKCIYLERFHLFFPFEWLLICFCFFIFVQQLTCDNHLLTVSHMKGIFFYLWSLVINEGM